MSGSIADRKRLIRVTAGNIGNESITITGHHDFFPPDCIGSSKRSANGQTKPIHIFLDGLNSTVETDIPRDPKTGRPRGIFRGRKWVRQFFEYHAVKDGDVLALEQIDTRRYRLGITHERITGNKNGRAKSRRMESKRKLTFAEFFAGIGLVRLALENQGWRVVFANDICPEKAEMYQHNWPGDGNLVVGDIHRIDADEVPTCDLFTASFPCNDLSIAGAWAGLDGKESSAFWGLIKILQDLGKRRPPLVMLENVLGFMQSRGGKDLETALLALNELGYAVDAFVLNARNWVPQSRSRLFVLAKRGKASESGKTFAFESDTRPHALSVFINTHSNIRWDIASLPILPEPRRKLDDIVEDLPDDDPHWWNKKRTDYFFNQLSERHLKAAKIMIEQRSYHFATAFRRVRYGRSMAELRTEHCEMLAPPHLRQRAA